MITLRSPKRRVRTEFCQKRAKVHPQNDWKYIKIERGLIHKNQTENMFQKWRACVCTRDILLDWTYIRKSVRAAEGLHRAVVAVAAQNAKVRQFDDALVIEQHVLRLDLQQKPRVNRDQVRF